MSVSLKLSNPTAMYIVATAPDHYKYRFFQLKSAWDDVAHALMGFHVLDEVEGTEHSQALSRVARGSQAICNACDAISEDLTVLDTATEDAVYSMFLPGHDAVELSKDAEKAYTKIKGSLADTAIPTAQAVEKASSEADTPGELKSMDMDDIYRLAHESGTLFAECMNLLASVFEGK